MAVKIRLKRIGKKFAPAYRVVVLDARKKRDGRVIEEIGLYDPMQEPSLIRIDSERVRYWLGVGAQPPIPEGKLRVKDEAAEAAARQEAIRSAADDAEKRKATAAAAAQEAGAAEQAAEGA